MVGEARESAAPVRPLQGKRVLVTRAREQAEPLSAALRAAGAVPVEFPAIRIEPAADYTALDEALRAVQRYDWAIFTSVNAIAHVERRLQSLGLSWQALHLKLTPRKACAVFCEACIQGVTAALVSPRQLTPIRNPSGAEGPAGFSSWATNSL